MVIPLLFMSDAIGGGGTAVADGGEIDPLSQAAGGIAAPKFPCLQADRVVRFRISKITKAPSKDNASRETLTILMKTESDQVDTDGQALRAGFAGYKRIGITPTPEEDGKRARTVKEIAADVAMLLKACGKKDVSPRQLFDNPSMLDQEVVDVKVGLQPEKNGYPQSNTFTFVLPA